MWGSNAHNLTKKDQILVEYTSPNLFKPLHIGNLVGNVVGEALSRLFEFSGAVVRRINYPSDIGLTVAKGVWGLKKTQGNPDDILALGAYIVAVLKLGIQEAFGIRLQEIHRKVNPLKFFSSNI